MTYSYAKNYPILTVISETKDEYKGPNLVITGGFSEERIFKLKQEGGNLGGSVG